MTEVDDRVQLADLEYHHANVAVDSDLVREVQEHTNTLSQKGEWDNEEGYRLPQPVQINSRTKAVCRGQKYVATLRTLGQDWIHPDDVRSTDAFWHLASDQLEPLLVPIEDLIPDPVNARSHNERNLTTICNSLQAYGQHRPAVVHKQSGIVRIGNGMLEAATRLGWTHLACLLVDEDNVQSIARGIADNKTGDLADWDWETLSKLMTGLQEDNFDLELTGFADYEISPLMHAEWSPATPDPRGLDVDDEPGKAPDTSPVDSVVQHALEFTQEQWDELHLGALAYLHQTESEDEAKERGDKPLDLVQIILNMASEWVEVPE